MAKNRKNDNIDNFCRENRIKHIFSSLYIPSINGVVEFTHKEIRKYIMLNNIESEDNFEKNNIILEAKNLHNNNIHTSTGYKPI